MEARGFIIGGAVAHQLSAGFVPIRKKGKLPGAVISQAYQLEYGEAVMEIHDDAIRPGERVLIVDDLLATGGTASAASATRGAPPRANASRSRAASRPRWMSSLRNTALAESALAVRLATSARSTGLLVRTRPER